MSWITLRREGVVLQIHASPRAARTEIQGLHGDALKIRLKAPPVDGKANEALLRFLSDRLGVPLRQLTLLSGDTGRQKRIAVLNLSEAQVRQALDVT